MDSLLRKEGRYVSTAKAKDVKISVEKVEPFFPQSEVVSVLRSTDLPSVSGTGTPGPAAMDEVLAFS
jgi:hypothetical protein